VFDASVDYDSLKPLYEMGYGAMQPTSYWSVPEVRDFPILLAHFGRDFDGISNFMKTKTPIMVRFYLLICFYAISGFFILPMLVAAIGPRTVPQIVTWSTSSCPVRSLVLHSFLFVPDLFRFAFCLLGFSVDNTDNSTGQKLLPTQDRFR
jgi:hypothetical protein